MNSKSIHQDVFISVIIYIALGFFFYKTVNLPPNSAIFPRMILAASAALNTSVFVNGIRKTKLMRGGNTSIVNSIKFSVVKVPLTIYLILVGYVILFRYTNYFIASSIMLLTVMLFYKIRSWKVLVSVIAVYNLFIYLLFVLQLGVQL